jgi:3-phenylpropionate/cinnamic acid dioxygenase small subunit
MDDDATRLIDRLDVMELVNRYGRAMDRRDWDAFAAVFAEDATADYTSVIARTRREDTTTPEAAVLRGRAAIVEWMQAARVNGETLLHFMTNHIVEVDGDRATLWNYVHERQGAYGSYAIEAVRTDEGWRIRSLVLDLTPRPSKLA